MEDEYVPLVNYPKYEINKNGIVKNIKTRYVLSFYEIRGYDTVSIGSRGASIMIHKLVAKTFIPNPEKLIFVKHLDNNKKNNNVNNLKWVNRSDLFRNVD